MRAAAQHVSLKKPSENPLFGIAWQDLCVLLAFLISRINALRGYLTENKSWLRFPS